MSATISVERDNAVEIFAKDKLYGQTEFTAKGCGGKTRWWAHIKNGDFPVVEVGRLKKTTGAALNSYFSGIKK